MKRILLAAALLLGLAQAAHATKTDDNFVDAGAPICLESHTPPGGGSWTRKGGTACASGTSGIAVNVSGTLHSYVNNNTSFWAADTATDDQSITITVATTGNPTKRLLLRSTASQSGIMLQPVSGSTWTVCDLVVGTCNAGSVTNSAGTISAGDTIQFIVSGTAATVKHNGTTISALNFTTAAYTSGKHLGFTAPAIGDLFTNWLSDDFASNTLDISDPITQKNHQVIPPATVSATCSDKVFTGTYIGRVASNIDIQLYQTDGTTVVQAWTALTSPTIASGNWSGTLCVPFETQMMRAQARETDSTSITSLVTTNDFGAGPTPLMIGQSQIAHFWGISAQTVLGTTTDSSTTVGLPNPGTGLAPFPLAAYLIGCSLTGTNIPGGTTITSPFVTSGDPETFIITPNPATGTATGTATLNVCLTVPTANAATWRYSAGTSAVTVNPVGQAQQTGEPISQQANGEGALEISNLLTNRYSSASMLIEAAVGGTTISHWVSGTGDDWSGTVTTLGRIGNDFDRVFWSQGQSDTQIPISYASYLSSLQNVETWVHGFRASAPFFIIPIGTWTTGPSSDAEWEDVKQAQLTSIDNDSGVFWGGAEVDLPYVTNDPHLQPIGRIRLAKRMDIAAAKQAGLTTSGYGPKIDQTRVTWNGLTKVTIPVIQEGAATLTCKNLSTSCAAMTGFRVFANGSPATISSTAFVQPNKIELTLSARPAFPVTVDYLYGIEPITTNAVYDDQAPDSDTDGLPLQPSRGLGATGHFTAMPPSGFIQGAPG